MPIPIKPRSIPRSLYGAAHQEGDDQDDGESSELERFEHLVTEHDTQHHRDDGTRYPMIEAPSATR